MRIQLDIQGKKRPRPARFLEFSDYNSLNGIGPYSSQVSTIDLSAIDTRLKGFSGAFTAFTPAPYLNETYTVPADDDARYTRTVWRIILESQYSPSATHVGFGSPPRLMLDTEYLYLSPNYNGQDFFGTVVRISTPTFAATAPVVERLDLTTINANLTGFSSAFTDDTYGYLVPGENANGLGGLLVRFSLRDFTTAGVTVLNLAAINPSFVGFSNVFTCKVLVSRLVLSFLGLLTALCKTTTTKHLDGTAAYLVPDERPKQGDELLTNLREFPVPNSGKIIKIDLASSFQVTDVLDLAQIHPQLVGFSGAVVGTLLRFAL